MALILTQNVAFFAQAPAPTSMGEVFTWYVVLFVYFAVVYPLLGGAVMWLGFQWAKVPDFTFVKCWKIYLAGLCYGYLVIMGTVLLLQQPMPVFQTVLFYLIPMVAIPLLGRDYSKRTIAVEIAVVLVANSIMLGMAYFLASPGDRTQLTPTESTTRQRSPNSKSESPDSKKINHRGTESTEKKDTDKKDTKKN